LTMQWSLVPKHSPTVRLDIRSSPRLK
jgi:hypothetical protein